VVVVVVVDVLDVVVEDEEEEDVPVLVEEALVVVELVVVTVPDWMASAITPKSQSWVVPSLRVAEESAEEVTSYWAKAFCPLVPAWMSVNPAPAVCLMEPVSPPNW
jgi:hypothetical protein